MNQLRLLVLIFLSVVFFCSCSNNVLELSCTPIILDSTDTISISFDDCFEITSCIPLEETSDCYMSSPRRVEFFKGKYYVSSSNADFGLVVYDAKGSFVSRIGKKGHGRGEYTNIYDFSIDQKNRRILIICDKSSLVKVYSLDGIFQKEKVIHNTLLSNLACVNGLVLCPTNHQGFTKYPSDSLFYIFDENLNFVKKHTYISNNSLGMTSPIPSNIRTYGEKFVYSDFHEHRTFILNKYGDIEKCFQYEEDGLVPIAALKSPKIFMANQFVYDFILGSAIVDEKCITTYKAGRRMKLSINNNNGDCIVNKPLSTLLPDFHGYENNQILSVISIETLKSLTKTSFHNYIGNARYFIIKYKLKES